MPYTTISGDHWDEIARKVYGTERAVGWLWQHNPGLVDVYRFDGGVTLQTPELPETEDTTELPPWRRN